MRTFKHQDVKSCANSRWTLDTDGVVRISYLNHVDRTPKVVPGFRQADVEHLLAAGTWIEIESIDDIPKTEMDAW